MNIMFHLRDPVGPVVVVTGHCETERVTAVSYNIPLHRCADPHAFWKKHKLLFIHTHQEQ